MTELQDRYGPFTREVPPDEQSWRQKSRNTDALALRRAEAVKLRVQGLTFKQIAERLGIGGDTALKDVRSVIQQEVSAAVDELRQVEDMRLNAVIAQAVKVLQEQQDDPELVLKALDRIMRAGKHRRDLWGLDVPPRLDVTVHQLSDTDRELYELINEAKARNAVTEQRLAGDSDR